MFGNVQIAGLVVFYATAVLSIPIGQAVLRKVVAKLGGTDKAAERLGVSPGIVGRYLDGSAPVPDTVLLRAVDVVLDEFQQAPSGESKPFSRSAR